MLLGATPTTLLQPCCAHSFYFSYFHPKNRIVNIPNCYLISVLTGILSVLRFTLTHSVVHFLPLSPISKPTQVPSISLAFCLEAMHPSDPTAKKAFAQAFFAI